MNTMIQEEDDDNIERDENYRNNLDLGDDDFSPPRYDGGVSHSNYQSSRLNMTELVLNTAVNRLFEDATRRKELKERIQLLSAKKELEELRSQPEINKKSERLIKEYVPIHERYEKVLNDKEIKKAQKKAEIVQEKLKKEPEPRPQPKKQVSERDKDFEEFLKKSEKWLIEK